MRNRLSLLFILVMGLLYSNAEAFAQLPIDAIPVFDFSASPAARNDAAVGSQTPSPVTPAMGAQQVRIDIDVAREYARNMPPYNFVEKSFGNVFDLDRADFRQKNIALKIYGLNIFVAACTPYLDNNAVTCRNDIFAFAKKNGYQRGQAGHLPMAPRRQA